MNRSVPRQQERATTSVPSSRLRSLFRVLRYLGGVLSWHRGPCVQRLRLCRPWLRVQGEAIMTTATRRGDIQQPDRAQPTAKSRIGLIVALSMAAGLIVAVILVAMPFIPARENVLTGAVLLAFALGWALLAVLSTRFSDQPQRCAAARPRSWRWPASFHSAGPPPCRRCSAGYGRRSCSDWLSGCSFGSGASCEADRTVAAVPRTSCVDDRFGGRRLPDRARIARRQGLYPARPADRCGRAPVASVLHRLRQPHRRPGTWSAARRPPTSAGLPRPSPATPESASTTAPAAAGATQPTARRTVPTLPRTCTPCSNGPTFPGRTCWPVTRSAACTSKLRRPIPRSGRRHGAPRLHRTQTRPSPAHRHRSLQRHRSRRRLIGRVRSLGAGRLLNPISYTTLPPRSRDEARATPRPPAALQAPSRSMEWRTRRCSRHRP